MLCEWISDVIDFHSNYAKCLRTQSSVFLILPGSKLCPGTGSTEGEQDSGAAAGRKRRWGSSTAVTAKKPSISITTDSLKVLAALWSLTVVLM